MTVDKLSRLKILAFALFAVAPAAADKPCLDSLDEFRAEAESFYLDPETSPFSEEFRNEFPGFAYFESDARYCVDASYRETENTKTIEFPTFNDKTMPFREHGVFEFELNDERHTLTAYQRMDLPEDKRQWVLVAFRDLTNGKGSYGGGRYLEIDLPIDASTILNFNRAANPFCAYDPKFVCPVPPIENWLQVRIPAGELDFTGIRNNDSAHELSLFAVEVKVGPNWNPSKPPHEQAFFNDHSANMKRLRESGHIVMGARYSDIGLLVFKAESADSVRVMMNNDPSMAAGTFVFEVHPLNVFYPGAVGQ